MGIPYNRGATNPGLCGGVAYVQVATFACIAGEEKISDSGQEFLAVQLMRLTVGSPHYLVPMAQTL
jgi:hypothetical protein